MLIGYARVSTQDQNAEQQMAALEAAGCGKVFVDEASGSHRDRPKLQELLQHLREDDVLVVWKLDRLSRSLKDLLGLLAELDERGCGFRSLTEHVDTTSAAGRMLMQMLGAFAEFEREMIRERTMAGLAAARKKGRRGGRPPKLNEDQRAEVLAGILEGRWNVSEAARLFGVHRSTIHRLLKAEGGS